MPNPALWKGIVAVFRVVGRVIGVLRKIPILDDLTDRVQRRLLNPVVVKLIRDADDPDLDAALELYRKRIPEDQRFEPTDIVRWLREDRINRKTNPSGPSDWFLVAKVRRRVCGLVLFHYYPSVKLALFAYMVVSNTPGIHFNAASRSLSGEVSRLLRKKKELRGYKGFVLEAEDPRQQRTQRKQDEALGRIRRFCFLAQTQGFSLRAFNFDYKQPKLSIEARDGSECRLLLLSARVRPQNTHAVDAREELSEVLKFVYTKVYPEGYSEDVNENKLYREYCERLLCEQLAALPEIVHSLSSAQLAAQITKSRKRRQQCSS